MTDVIYCTHRVRIAVLHGNLFHTCPRRAVAYIRGEAYCRKHLEQAAAEVVNTETISGAGRMQEWTLERRMVV